MGSFAPCRIRHVRNVRLYRDMLGHVDLDHSFIELEGFESGSWLVNLVGWLVFYSTRMIYGAVSMGTTFNDNDIVTIRYTLDRQENERDKCLSILAHDIFRNLKSRWGREAARI
jgi:hypothetical protein